MSWRQGGATLLPNTPEKTKADKQCSRCPAQCNAHQGVEIRPGVWICGRCHRLPLTGKARRKK